MLLDLSVGLPKFAKTLQPLHDSLTVENAFKTTRNTACRANKMSIITCCGICNCLAGDARWWFLELVGGICRRRGGAGAAAHHIMRWIRWAVIILCVLALAETGIRRIVLANQTTQKSSVKKYGCLFLILQTKLNLHRNTQNHWLTCSDLQMNFI